MTFVDGGEPVGPLERVGDSDEHRHVGHVLARPDDHGRGRVPRPDPRRAAARDGVPQQEPRDRLPRRARRRADRADLQVRRRHRRLRRAPQRVEGAVVRDGHRHRATPTTSGEVEIALQWNTGFYEGLHSFANNIATTEGGMHEEGFKKSLTNVVNRYARAEGPPQGEGREPPRRGHPRGPHRDRVGEAAQPAVRGADQDQARQHRDPLVRRAGHQREARASGSRSTRPRPRRSSPSRRRPRTARMAARQARDLTRRKSLLESALDAGQARRLLDAQRRRGRAVHRRGRQRRRQRQEGAQPARSRRSCRSAARS